MTSDARGNGHDPRRAVLECRTEVVSNCTVIHVSGEVDLATIHVLIGAPDSARAAPHPILVDLAETKYIDTTGIHALLHARERHDNTLAVAALAPTLKRIFDVLEIGRIIPVYDTLKAALSTVCPPSAASGARRP